MNSNDIDSVSQMLSLHTDDFVKVSYEKILGRFPELNEIIQNIGALRCGLGRVQFLENIRYSDEFRARFDKIINEGDNEFFIHRAFSMYLNRKPDPAGLAYYTDLLDSGKSRDTIYRDIATSKESRKTYTFWYEMDRLLEDHRSGNHPIKRWIGKRRRESRQANRNFEVNMNISNIGTIKNSSLMSTSQSWKEENCKSNKISNDIRNSDNYGRLIAMGDYGLKGAAAKILSRIQHASAPFSNGNKF